MSILAILSGSRLTLSMEASTSKNLAPGHESLRKPSVLLKADKQFCNTKPIQVCGERGTLGWPECDEVIAVLFYHISSICLRISRLGYVLMSGSADPAMLVPASNSVAIYSLWRAAVA